MTKIDFISGLEIPVSDLDQIIQDAINFKNGSIPNLNKQILTLFFANPSLRTRLSFESGMQKMNGIVNILGGGDTWNFEYQDGVVMDQDKQEHIKEMAKVVSRYSDILGMRKSDLITTNTSQSTTQTWLELKQDLAINKLAQHATVPVINMESNMHHPCQGLSDVMTMKEKLHSLKNKKYVLTWAPHPKALPLATPHSQMLFPAMFGMNVTVAHPEGFELDSDLIQIAKQKSEQAGGSFTVTNDQQSAFDGAEVIMAKSWASLRCFGDWEAEANHRKKFSDWTVDPAKMNQTNNAYFMHCLPVRRNVVVSDQVLDGPNSIIFDQAENRMWAQMSLVNYLLNIKKNAN